MLLEVDGTYIPCKSQKDQYKFQKSMAVEGTDNQVPTLNMGEKEWDEVRSTHGIDSFSSQSAYVCDICSFYHQQFVDIACLLLF